MSPLYIYIYTTWKGSIVQPPLVLVYHGPINSSQPSLGVAIAIDPFTTVYSKQGSLHYQRKQCPMKGKFPQNHHTFALFDPPKMGNFNNLMIPVSQRYSRIYNYGSVLSIGLPTLDRGGAYPILDHHQDDIRSIFR